MAFAYVAKAPPLGEVVSQQRKQSGPREEVDALKDPVFEEDSPDRMGMPDRARQKQNDHECLEDDGQLTRADEGAPQKRTVRAEEELGPAPRARRVLELNARIGF